MARKRTNGRFTKSTRRRTNRKPKTNLTNLAVSALVANSVSKNVAGINIRDFLFAGTQFSDLHESGWNYINSAADGRNAYNSIVTLSEIFRGTQGSVGRTSPGTQMMDNLKANWLPLTVGVIGIPIAAKVGMKLIRKPIILPLNRAIKSIGLDVKV